MYWHYIRHGLRPSEYYSMNPGEKVVLRAFMLKEIESENEQRKEIEKAKGGN